MHTLRPVSVLTPSGLLSPSGPERFPRAILRSSSNSQAPRRVPPLSPAFVVVSAHRNVHRVPPPQCVGRRQRWAAVLLPGTPRPLPRSDGCPVNATAGAVWADRRWPPPPSHTIPTLSVGRIPSTPTPSFTPPPPCAPPIRRCAGRACSRPPPPVRPPLGRPLSIYIEMQPSCCVVCGDRSLCGGVCRDVPPFVAFAEPDRATDMAAEAGGGGLMWNAEPTRCGFMRSCARRSL